MTTKIYIPRDAAALALGADKVAKGDGGRRSPRAASMACAIVRNGSRGLHWLEPLVEVETSEGARRLWAGEGP